MTKHALAERLSALSPIQSVSLAEKIVSRLSRTPQRVYDAEPHVAAAVRTSGDYKALMDRAMDDPAATLDEAASARIAATFLKAAAAMPELAPLVEAELDGFEDEKQFVMATLAVGFAVSMVIVVATTEFHYEDGKIVIKKAAASAELVEAAASITGIAAKT